MVVASGLMMPRDYDHLPYSKLIQILQRRNSKCRYCSMTDAATNKQAGLRRRRLLPRGAHVETYPSGVVCTAERNLNLSSKLSIRFRRIGETFVQEKSHWERVYTDKPAEAVSWYQEHADSSLALIRETGVALGAAIVDVGGGASTLVDDLLATGYSDLTVLDISAAALDVARSRLGVLADTVRWLEADIRQAEFKQHRFDLWHDRAVFHFLTDVTDRDLYLRAVSHAVKPGGFVIVGTFAENGPERCSGLPVQRYSADALHAEFGEQFELLGHAKKDHYTPFGTVQKFIYCYCRKLS